MNHVEIIESAQSELVKGAQSKLISDCNKALKNPKQQKHSSTNSSTN